MQQSARSGTDVIIFGPLALQNKINPADDMLKRTEHMKRRQAFRQDNQLKGYHPSNMFSAPISVGGGDILISELDSFFGRGSLVFLD